MIIVEIESEYDATAVLLQLRTLGVAWRPAEDAPEVVYIEDASLEDIERIPGVRACWEGRSGSIARLLHGLGEDGEDGEDALAAGTLSFTVLSRPRATATFCGRA